MKYGEKENSSPGFTLLEQLIVILLVGILSAASVPTFFGLLQRTKINQAADTLRIAVQEAQRQAIMKSKDCTIFLPVTNTTNPTLKSDCFVMGDRTLKEVKIRHNYASKSNKIVFNYRGRSNGLGTIVIDKIGENITHQRCLVISNFIGMSRSGEYNPKETTGVSASHCQTIQN
jgi:prepilin-type N-terminal cleavage/methylation domain-containing protein